MKRVACIMVLSEYMKNLAAEIDPTIEPKMVGIRPGIDLEEFRPADDRQQKRQTLGAEPTSFVMLVVRRLVPRMGIECLIDAIPLVLKKHSQIQLWIIGKGALESELKAKIKTLGIENAVLLMGFQKSCGEQLIIEGNTIEIYDDYRE